MRNSGFLNLHRRPRKSFSQRINILFCGSPIFILFHFLRKMKNVSTRSLVTLSVASSVCAVVSLLLVMVGSATLIDAKGLTGRSSYGSYYGGGGYYRASKIGYYSRTNRYYITNMGWRAGYSYAYRGPQLRTAGGPLTDAELAGIICKRNVTVDTTVANYANGITYNSTQRCYKESSEVAGDPTNTNVDNFMLNRFRFNYRVNDGAAPTVDMVVFPDKDIIVGLVNNTFRLTTLTFTSVAAGGGSTVVDLSTLTWRACSLATCSGGPQGFSYPSSRFVEGSRVYTVSVYADIPSPNVRVQLRFWLSSDFSEEPNYEHVFLMPGATKVDIMLTPATAAEAAMTVTLAALIAVPKAPGAGTTVTNIAIASDILGTEYGPQKMQRLDIGTTTDQQNGQGSYLSWSSSFDRNVLCFSPTDATCMSVNAVGTIPAPVCDAASLPLPTKCQSNFLRDGQVAYEFSWTSKGPMSSAITGFNWYFDFGYYDPSVGVQPDSGASAHTLSLIAVAVVATLLLMF